MKHEYEKNKRERHSYLGWWCHRRRELCMYVSIGIEFFLFNQFEMKMFAGTPLLSACTARRHTHTHTRTCHTSSLFSPTYSQNTHRTHKRDLSWYFFNVHTSIHSFIHTVSITTTTITRQPEDRPTTQPPCFNHKIQQERDDLLKIQQERDDLLKIQQEREIRK